MIEYWQSAYMFSQKDLLKIGKGHDMNYKKEIIEMIQKIDSEKFLKFLYNMIVSFKKQWGI